MPGFYWIHWEFERLRGTDRLLTRIVTIVSWLVLIGVVTFWFSHYYNGMQPILADNLTKVSGYLKWKYLALNVKNIFVHIATYHKVTWVLAGFIILGHVYKVWVHHVVCVFGAVLRIYLIFAASICNFFASDTPAQKSDETDHLVKPVTSPSPVPPVKPVKIETTEKVLNPPALTTKSTTLLKEPAYIKLDLPTQLTVDLTAYTTKIFLERSLDNYELFDLWAEFVDRKGTRFTRVRDGRVLDAILPSRDLLLQHRHYFVRNDAGYPGESHETRRIILGGTQYTCYVLEDWSGATLDRDWLHRHRIYFEGGRSRDIYAAVNHTLPVLGRYIPHTLYARREVLQPLAESGILRSELLSSFNTKTFVISGKKLTYCEIILEEVNHLRRFEIKSDM